MKGLLEKWLEGLKKETLVIIIISLIGAAATIFYFAKQIGYKEREKETIIEKLECIEQSLDLNGETIAILSNEGLRKSELKPAVREVITEENARQTHNIISYTNESENMKIRALLEYGEELKGNKELLQEIIESKQPTIREIIYIPDTTEKEKSVESLATRGSSSGLMYNRVLDDIQPKIDTTLRIEKRKGFLKRIFTKNKY